VELAAASCQAVLAEVAAEEPAQQVAELESSDTLA
jgi:hypothetical protein